MEALKAEPVAVQWVEHLVGATVDKLVASMAQNLAERLDVQMVHQMAEQLDE